MAGQRWFMLNHDGPWRVTAGNVLYRRRERSRERERERERAYTEEHANEGERQAREQAHDYSYVEARVLGARNQVGRW